MQLLRRGGVPAVRASSSATAAAPTSSGANGGFTSLTSSNRRVAPRRLLRRRGPAYPRADNGRSLSREQQELMEREFTAGGGGADGICDYEDIKEALKECDGLTGDAKKACWATVGCDVDGVTSHYTKAAGLKEGSTVARKGQDAKTDPEKK